MCQVVVEKGALRMKRGLTVIMSDIWGKKVKDEIRERKPEFQHASWAHDRVKLEVKKGLRSVSVIMGCWMGCVEIMYCSSRWDCLLKLISWMRRQYRWLRDKNISNLKVAWSNRQRREWMRSKESDRLAKIAGIEDWAAEEERATREMLAQSDGQSCGRRQVAWMTNRGCDKLWVWERSAVSSKSLAWNHSIELPMLRV